ncbi:MAG: TrmH family RNA methyltransferase [Spirochaetaceae bacterium]|nr:MAG: TrmH family RNA methyltransferase [Spirochaetaceae bacterium]
MPDCEYLCGLFSMLAREQKLPQSLRQRAQNYCEISARPNATLSADLIRPISDIRYGLQNYLGHTPADWDFYQSGQLDRSERRVQDIYLYLDDIRSPFNVGAIFRAADSFGVREIFLSEGCASPEHPRAARSSMGAVELIPWRCAALPQALRDIEQDRATQPSLLAVETGGVSLEQFRFPPVGMAVIGSEELGVSAEALVLAQASAGRVSIPTAGAKGSLNVAVAAGIVLYHWWRALSG